jgi:hypothetical protein
MAWQLSGSHISTAEMRFEVVHKNHLCAASDLEGEKLVVGLQDLVRPLAQRHKG